MPTSAQSDNLRESYRFAAIEPSRPAELRVGSDWIPVELLDTSAGGFGIKADRPLGISVGDSADLRLDDECFATRVMNIVEQAPDGGHEDPSFRLGLKRVGEVFFDEQEHVPWFAWIKGPARHLPSDSTKTLFYAALLFAAIAGAAPVIIIYLMDSPEPMDISRAGIGSDEAMQPWGSNSKPSAIRPVSETLDSSDVPHYGINRSLFGAKPSPAKPSLNGSQNDSFSLLLDRAKLQSNIGKWSDAVLSVIADLIEDLKLTAAQKEKIGKILRHADKEITQLNVPSPDNTPQKVARERLSILETAYNKLSQVFTDTQLTQWNELVKKWNESLQTPAEPQAGRD